MLLESILEKNRQFTAARKPQPLPPPEQVSLMVLACFDPRLDSLLLPALGLEREQLFLLRTGGAYLAPRGSTLRTLLVGVFLLGVRELLVLGHSSCRMAQFRADAFIDAFRGRGVGREAFGNEDLREWAGAIPSPRRGVELTVRNVLAEPACPPDLAVSGVLLDDTTGALELVVKPGETPVVEEITEAESEAAAEAKGEGPAASDDGAGEAEPPADPLIEAVDEVARILSSNTDWSYEVGRLRRTLSAPGNPLHKLQQVQSFARRIGSDSTELAVALEPMLRRVTAGGSIDKSELTRLLQHLVTRL